MDLSPAWLENMIDRQRMDGSVVKVLSLDKSPAAGKGDNYGSHISRLRMKVVLGSGVVTTKSVLLKTLPTEEPLREFLILFNAFPTEITVFSEILSECEQLMLERNDTEEKLWSDCLWWKRHESLIFQDLKESGYRNMSRTERMDIEHAELTLNSLGRLHGMSAVLLKERRIAVDQLKPCPMARNQEVNNLLLMSGLQTMARVMKETWGPEWNSTADELISMSENIGGKLQELCQAETDKLIVFNHGDCWINNIMFKYASWTSHPIGMRFVDFQESHFNTFGWDLTYLFHMSLSPSDVSENRDRLLGAYRDSLVETLATFGDGSVEAPSIGDIVEELDRLSLYGLVISLAFLPPVVADAECLIETADFFSLSESAYQNKKVLYTGQRFTEIIKCILNSRSSKNRI